MSNFRASLYGTARWMGVKTQWTLDQFYYFRGFLLNCVAFFSLRLYAKEVSYKDVHEGKYTENNAEEHEKAKYRHVNRHLDDAKDLDALLSLAKDCYKAAADRRTIVTDKCKTLLTMSTFILAISGLFLPKPFELDTSWPRYLVFVAGFLVLDAVLLLLVYFGIGDEEKLSLESHLVPLEKDDLKKALINEYLSCEVDSENRTSYLVDVYATARFFALSGFLLLLGLAAMSFLAHSPSASAKQSIEALRKDPQLMDLLRGSAGRDGPKGDRGDQGSQGLKGDTGAVGPKGHPGSVGPKGERGEKGEKGDIGKAATHKPD